VVVYYKSTILILTFKIICDIIIKEKNMINNNFIKEVILEAVKKDD